MTIRNCLIVPFSLLLLVVINTSCKKIKKTTTFSILDSTEFIIPASTQLNVPVEINTREVTTSSSQYFSDNKTNAALVKDIKLSALRLNITDPTGETFSFLKSIKIYIYGNGQPEVLMASKEDITNDASNPLDLETGNAKLDAYIKSNAYSLRYELVTDEIFSNDITIQTNLTYSVTASPL